jgi:hypothetical protein
MKSKILRMGQEYGGQITATFTVPRAQADDVHALIGADVSIDVKKYREKRSLSANGLLWAVCEELAESLKITKIEVYRKAIKDVGVYEPLPIRDDAVDAFCVNWEHGGIGWFADKTDKSKTPGYTLVFAYFGSSTYDSKQFSRLVDWLIDEAEQIGIVLKAGPELEQKAKEYGL